MEVVVKLALFFSCNQYTIKRPLSESASKSIEQSISDVEKVKNYLPHTF